MKRAHYTPCMVAADSSWVARAERAGTLDGFHGYPRQPPEGKAKREVTAYERGFQDGKKRRLYG